jgi:tetratricopeptide (TPR) repeat protein
MTRQSEYRQQVLAIRRELKDRGGEAASLFDVAWTYERLSRNEKALEFFQAALTINRELKNRREEGRSIESKRSQPSEKRRTEQQKDSSSVMTSLQNLTFIPPLKTRPSV